MHSGQNAISLQMAGFPIRIPPDHSLRTAPRGISVFAPSFFGSWRLGILRALLLPYPTGGRSTSHRVVTFPLSLGHVPLVYSPSVARFVPRPACVSLPSLPLYPSIARGIYRSHSPSDHSAGLFTLRVASSVVKEQSKDQGSLKTLRSFKTKPYRDPAFRCAATSFVTFLRSLDHVQTYAPSLAPSVPRISCASLAGAHVPCFASVALKPLP